MYAGRRGSLRRRNLRRFYVGSGIWCVGFYVAFDRLFEVLARDLQIMLLRHGFRVAQPGGGDVNGERLDQLGLSG